MFENEKAKTAEVKGAVSPEEAARLKKNEASKKVIARKKAAIAKLVDLAKRLGTPEEKEAAAYLSGERRAGGARTPAKDYVEILFKSEVGKTIGEGEVFKVTKMGRLEMRALIKKEVNRGNWISFDAEKEIYTFVAKGDKAPANWNGPQPKAKKL